MRTAVFVLILPILLPVRVVAQDTPTVDLSGGYAFHRIEDGEAAHGWYATLAGNLTRWFAIVGEVGAGYRSWELEWGGGRDPVEADVYSFLAGSRFASRGAPGVTVFAQMLAGAVQYRDRFLGHSSSSSKFALQPGGGADFWVTRRVGIRVAADYRLVIMDLGDDDYHGDLRGSVGIVAAFGAR